MNCSLHNRACRNLLTRWDQRAARRTAGKLPRKEAERREDRFRRSAEGEKTKAEVLERKFEESLKKNRGEPPTPPLRDIDLD